MQHVTLRYISFDDAEKELKRMDEYRKAQAEVDKGQETKAVSQKMFKVAQGVIWLIFRLDNDTNLRYTSCNANWYH